MSKIGAEHRELCGKLDIEHIGKRVYVQKQTRDRDILLLFGCLMKWKEEILLCEVLLVSRNKKREVEIRF